MAVESAADRAVFLGTDEFGEAIGWTVGAASSAINVVADTGTVRLDMQDGAGALDRRVTLLCREADIPTGAARGNAVTFRGAAHTVKSIEPDGEGMALVRLEKTVAD